MVHGPGEDAVVARFNKIPSRRFDQGELTTRRLAGGRGGKAATPAA
jgi:hypothetical protein